MAVTQTKPSKYQILIPTALLFLALLIRLFYLSEIKASPFFNNPVIDSQFHDEWAVQILKGDWFSHAQGVFYKAPLYPYFMALIYKIFSHDYYILSLIQLVLGSVSCLLIYFLAKTYFDKKTGYIAFFISALYGTFVYFDGEIEIVTLHTFLNLLLLLTINRAEKAQKIIWWFISGLILGISALSVPTILLFIPFILHLLCWNEVRAQKLFSLFSKKAVKNKPSQPFWPPALLLVLGTFIAIAPVTIHNYNHEKGLALVSANGGLNFYLGNNLHADQTIAIRPGLIWSHFTSQPHVAAGRTVGKIEEDKYWAEKSLAYVKNYPAHFTMGLFKKFALFWNAYEIKRNNDMYFQRQYSRLLRLPLFGFGLIAPLGIMGIILCLPQRRKYYMLLFYLAAGIFGIILFFVTDRYRVPAVPILIIFAAYAINWLWENKFDYQKVIYPALAIVFLSGLVNYDFWGLKANTFPDSHHNLGYIYYKNNKFEAAREEWETALKEYPPKDLRAVDTHYYLANLYNYKMKDYQKTIYHCQKALEILPNIAELETELGWALYQAGDKNKAVETLKAANAHDSLYEPAYTKLADIYSRDKRFEEAIETYKKTSIALKKDFKNEILKLEPKTYAKHGLEAAEKQNWMEAEKFFRLALEKEPDSAPNEYNLGLVYLNTTRYDLAAQHLEKSTSLDPARAEAFGAMGSAYLMQKKYNEAKKAFTRALEINPQLEIAKQQLALCK